MPLIDYLVPLALFAALILAASLFGLAVSGHFPRRQKGTAFASAFGAIILFGSIALVIAGLAGGIMGALHFVPWYAAIIGGGFALLAAPLVLRVVSRPLCRWPQRAARLCRRSAPRSPCC